LFLSFKEAAAAQFTQGNPPEALINCLKESFEELENEIIFHEYATFCENIILKGYGGNIGSNHLRELYIFFGQNSDSNTLFDSWKQSMLFRIGIALEEGKDYELSETLVREKQKELDVSELIRIRDFSYGESYLTEYLNYFLESSEISLESLGNMVQVFGEPATSELKELKNRFNERYLKEYLGFVESKFSPDLILEGQKDDRIFQQLIANISKHITSENQKLIRDRIKELIFKKLNPNSILELWINGIIDQVPTSILMEYFEDPEIKLDRQVQIIDTCFLDQKLEILANYSEAFGEVEAIGIIKIFLKSKNPHLQGQIEKAGLFDSAFWENVKGTDLLIGFHDYLKQTLSEERKLELFFQGFYQTPPYSQLISQYPNFEQNQWKKLFWKGHFEFSDLSKWYLRYLEKFSEDAEWVYHQAEENLSEKDFEDFDQAAFELIEASTYFRLWKSGKAKVVPYATIPEILQGEWDDYKFLLDCIDQGIMSKEDLEIILLDLIRFNQNSENRVTFKKIEFALFALNVINEKFKINPTIQSSSVAKLILWANGKEESLDFETLTGKFIYFSPEKQVEIIKKLFYLKATGQFDLTTEKLSLLTKFDLDLFLLNQQDHPEIPVDVSTDLLVKLLESIQNKGDFLFESDLITLVLNDLLFDQTKKFKFDHFFERCKGRTEVDHERHINGSVEKKPYKDKFYFEIFIEPEINHWKYNPDKNPDFQKITTEIKSIPGSKFNYSENYWGVPGNQETVVWKLAVNHKFRITNSDGELGANKHLASKRLTSVPNGITFCEGRLSNKKDNTLNEQFWWCNGMPCLSHCETIHSAEDWKNYTLLDFLRILNINTDEITTKGEMIPHGKFYRLISTINRFNELLKKLYCKECDHILHPVEIGNFGARNVTRFHCVNDKCGNEEVVYLNHCLNGKCNNIVDSRESKTCPNGLYICDKCGCCCSHAQASRRFQNLKVNGASISSSLSNSLNKQLGHLERRIFFCYKCGGNMEEDRSNKDILKCSDCKVEYNLKPYHFKFPNIDLPKESTDFALSKKPPGNLEEDLPF